MKTVLFLHMGPGLNAYCERRLLSAAYPQVEFWDQPKIAQPANAFSQLVQSACEKIQQVSAEAGQPITLWCHSFGGHIATHALNSVAKYVKAIEFVSTGYDLPTGFLNLLKQLDADSLTAGELKLETSRFLKDHSAEARADQLWDYINLIIRDPNFMRFYWPTPSLFVKYSRIAQSGPALDFPTFQNVLSDFMQSVWTPNPKPSSWSGLVQVKLGGKDPLILIDQETFLWQRIYPQAKFEIHHNSGHYQHLENSLNKI